jgi:hypothetical protein
MSIQDKVGAERSEQAEAAHAARVQAARAAESGRKPLVEGRALELAQEAQRLAAQAQEASEPARPRPGRKPFGAQEQTLAWPPIPGFRLYWFNDTPGRVDRAKEAGYEHVRDPETSSPVKRNVGRGENGAGLQSFLMKIPEEWYREDQAAVNAAESEKLRNIREGKTSAPPGSNQYVPSQGIKMDRR